MNYILSCLMAGLGIFGLLKDWDAHKHSVRQYGVLVSIILVLVFNCVSIYRTEAAATKRDNESQQTAKKLTDDLDSANTKLEYTKGQLSIIAGLLKANNADPATLADAISKALHPPEKSPCLNPAPFTAKSRQSKESGYETVIEVANPTGIRAHTTFQAFFDGVVWMVTTEDKTLASGGGAGGNIGSVQIMGEVPKGHSLVLLAESSFRPVEVKCVDRFEPTQKP